MLSDVVLTNRDRPLFRYTAVFTAAIFFHVTLFLSLNHDGSFGVQEAHAAGPESDKDKPAIFVLNFQKGGDYVKSISVNRIQEYLRTLVSMNSSVRMVTQAIKPPEVKKPTERAAVKRPLEQNKDLQAADALWKGKERLEKSMWKRAAKNFNRAIKLYHKRIELLEDLDKLVEAQLFLSLARFAQGFTDDGEEALARVVVLRPDLIVDKRWQSPEFTKALQRLKSGLSRVPTGKIKVPAVAAVPDLRGRAPERHRGGRGRGPAARSSLHSDRRAGPQALGEEGPHPRQG